VRKIIAGSILLSGGLFFLTASVIVSNLRLILGRDLFRRFFGATVSEVYLYPLFVISFIAVIAGLATLIWGIYSKSNNN